VVTIAAVILAVLALINLVHAIASLLAISHTVNRFRARAVAEGLLLTNIDQFVTTIRVLFVLSALITFVFAIVLAALAWGVLQGSRPARIVTWIVCGLGVLCGCCGVCSAGSMGLRNMNARPATDDMTRASQAMVDSFPGWFSTLSGVSSALQVLGYIATAVLLALPAAHVFFRRPEPTWQPPSTTPEPPTV
jgi:hypothetical protein